MLIFHEEVFDEIITGTGPWYTPAAFNKLLGSAELLCIMAFTTSTTGTPTLNVFTDFSADDQNWVLGTALISDPISNNLLLQGTTGAALSFGRLRITMGGSDLHCRLKLSVTGRSI